MVQRLKPFVNALSLHTQVQSRWRIRCRIGSLIVILIVAAALPAPLHAAQHRAPIAQSVSDPLVLAFYYTWFDENTWSAGNLSDLPAQQYASRDREAMGRHIEQAKAAGIDAFLVAWYGPGGGNQTETNLAALLEEASQRNFRIGVLFETNSPFFGGVGDVVGALQHLNNVHMAQSAYLRVDGRPVVFFWRPTSYGIDTWRSIRAQADPNYQHVWISEGVDTSYLQIFDGHHLYSNTWNPPADLSAVNSKFAALVQSASASHGAPKLWVATVMPGYNDTGIRSNGFARDRAGGAYFSDSWQAAINSQPNWIVVNSFNEWPEGSYIEPSTAYGDQFIGLCATWSSTFKSGANPSISPAAFQPTAPDDVQPNVVQPEAVQPEAVQPEPVLPQASQLPEMDSPTAYVNTALLNLRAGPSTDHEIIDIVAKGAAFPISGRIDDQENWLRISYRTGTAWVHTDYVTISGPWEEIPLLLSASDDGSDLDAKVQGYQRFIMPHAKARPLIPMRIH